MSKRVILPRVSMNHEELFDLTGRTGSYFYMAPEVLHEEAYNEKVHVISYIFLEGPCHLPVQPGWARNCVADVSSGLCVHRLIFAFAWCCEKMLG